MSPQELAAFDDRMLKLLQKELLIALEKGNRKYYDFLKTTLAEWKQIINHEKSCILQKDF